MRSTVALFIGVVALAAVACEASASTVIPASIVPSATPTPTPTPGIDGVGLAAAVAANLQADPFIAHAGVPSLVFGLPTVVLRSWALGLHTGGAHSGLPADPSHDQQATVEKH